MTGQFNNLKQFEIDPNKEVKYELMDIQMKGETPFLMVKPATEINKPFARAQLQRSNKRVKSMNARGVSLEALDANRSDDRDLYPRFVIMGWGHVYNTDGNAVPYSVKDCKDFLDNLPNWIFDGLRVYCTNPTSFSEMVDEDELGN